MKSPDKVSLAPEKKFENGNISAESSKTEYPNKEGERAIVIRKEIIKAIESSPAVQAFIKIKEWMQIMNMRRGMSDTTDEMLKKLESHPDVKLYKVLDDWDSFCEEIFHEK